jgi:predicted nucleic acid-binding protein
MSRIYVDTSVFGGCFDDEFAEDSGRLFKLAMAGRFRLAVNAVVVQELSAAPLEVRRLFESLRPGQIDELPLTDAVLTLRDAYLAAGIVGPKSRADATHVASASAGGVDAIVSWNFKHIVQMDRIKAYNSVNGRLGYGNLTIVTPMEVVREIDSQD